MSQENVDAMRRAIEVWNRDDFDAYVELVEELVHPDLEWFAVIAQLVEGQDAVYRGAAGMRRFWQDVDLETPLAMVVTFEGNRVIRSLSYLDHAEALEAVGLPG